MEIMCCFECKVLAAWGNSHSYSLVVIIQKYMTDQNNLLY